MYDMVCTKPNIAHSMGVLSRYMSKPRKEHWKAVKRVLIYLCGTNNFLIFYQGQRKEKSLDIEGFVDVFWGGDLDNRRYNSGYVFYLFRGDISWMSKKQVIVSLSTTEAEDMASTHASKEAI